MPKFNVTRKYSHSAEDLFAVAADVPAYHNFVPLVRISRVWDRKQNADGTESFKAALTIVYKRLNMRETIESDMVVDPKTRTITATSSDGILSSMHSVWKVNALPGGGAEVEMDVDYTMKSKMMQVLVSGMFDLALRKIANALGERVEKLSARKRAATA